MKINMRVVVLVCFVVVLCMGCKQMDGLQLGKVQDPIVVSTEQENSDDIVLTDTIIEETEERQQDSQMTKEETAEETIEANINTMLEQMTLEEKVAQLFVVVPESLMDNMICVTAAGEMTQNAINDIPVGGFIYLSNNLESHQQVKEMLHNVQEYSIDRIGVPAFLCVDEEGGTVTRIGGSGKFDVATIEDMSIVGQSKDYNRANEIGITIGQYLSELGFNVDFAPVADVLTNSDNQIVKTRSFGQDPVLVADMSLAMINGLETNGVYGSFKHFPGHGMTMGDTHEGYAYSNKTLEEIRACELIPFQRGIDEGVSFIMVGHISLPTIIGDNTPASLSEYMISDVLRGQMGYEGIVVTDAMNMGAIVQQYSSSDAAVKALQAGADIILMPEDFKSAYNGVIKAVEDGTISSDRIDESLRRILYVKFELKEHM